MAKGEYKKEKDRPPQGKQYKIKKRQLDRAKKMKVVIRVAQDRTKKIDVFSPDKKVKDPKTGKMILERGQRLSTIGGMYQDGTPYGDYATYLEKPFLIKSGEPINANEQRKLYLARHSHEAKEKVNPKTGKKEKTPSYWADNILWA